MGVWPKKKPPVQATFRRPGSVFVAETGYFTAVMASQAGFEPATRCLEGPLTRVRLYLAV